MNPHFMSIGMILTHPEHRYLTAMDVLAGAIANENYNPEFPGIIAFMFREAPPKGTDHA